MPPKFLDNIVILCIERRFSKQNSVIRLKSNILLPLKFFGPPKFFGWLRHCFARQHATYFCVVATVARTLPYQRQYKTKPTMHF